MSLLKKITNFLDDEETVARYRVSDTDFTRNRALGFKRLVLFMLQFGKSSIQHELDTFFYSFNQLEMTPTKSAFSQQRKKLKPELFKALNDLILQMIYSEDHTKVKKWKGHRVVALDGSTIQLPKSDDSKNTFGVFETRTENDRQVIMGRVSALYDVMNNQALDAKLTNYSIGELTLAEQQVKVLNNNDILVADRAYSAFWFMSLLHHSNKHFVIRLKANRWKIGKQFLESKSKDKLIMVHPCNEAKKKCKQKGIPAKPIELRLVKSRAKGEDCVIITNLIDQQEYSTKHIKSLYRSRWDIEEYFKYLKLREELENLSGKTTIAIFQDFYRIIFRANFVKVIANKLTCKHVRKVNAKRKNKYQINLAQTGRKAKLLLRKLLTTELETWLDLLNEMKTKLVAQLEIVRKGRSVPIYRRYGARPANFMAYKP